jgi:hypothetical protein
MVKYAVSFDLMLDGDKVLSKAEVIRLLEERIGYSAISFVDVELIKEL